MISSNISNGKIVSEFKSGSKEIIMSKNKKSAWWLSGGTVTPPYEPVNSEVTTWIDAGIAAGDSRISNTIAQSVDTLVTTFKSLGVWSKLDRAWICALDNENLNHQWRLNLLNPAVSKLTDVGTIQKTIVGFLADGTVSYVDTNFNPATAGVNYTQNSASRLMYLYATPSIGIRIDGVTASAANTIAIASGVTQRINQGTNNLDVAIGYAGDGYKAINRSDANAVQGYDRKVRQDAVRASSAPSSANQVIGRSTTNTFSNSTISFYAMGGSLTEAENNGIADALEAYFVNAGLRSSFVPFFYTNGQSNDQSRDDTTRWAALTPYTMVVNPIQQHYRKTVYDTTDNGAFQTLTMGLNNYGANGTSYATGMEVVIGKKMYDKKLDHYYLKASLGATQLDQSGAFDWYPTTLNQCFQISTQTMFLPALADIQARWPAKTIKPVIVWHQGESDEDLANGPANYLANFTAFVTALRAVDSVLATAPLFAVKLYWNLNSDEDTINAALQTYCAGNANCYFIDPAARVLASATPYVRKVDYPTDIKTNYPTAGADDNHWTCYAQIAKAELILEKLEEIGYF